MGAMNMFRGGRPRRWGGNNRKMTRGRVSAGKNTFKGTEAEHRVVRIEKKIREFSRMIFAIDLKIKKDIDSGAIVAYNNERDILESKMEAHINTLQTMTDRHRFNDFLKEMNKTDSHRRGNHNLKAA